jgi:hypothetical protein
MTKTILSVILCGTVCAGFVGWRVHVHANQSPTHVEIVFDASLSHPEGCESVVGLAEQSLRTNGVSKDSTLTILVLGDASTANEPWQLGRYASPVTNKVLEGKAANTRRQEVLLSDIQRKCETFRRTSISPIFLGVKQAVADLRAHGCKAASHCQVLVDSDLEENAEISIKNALNGTRNTKLALPAPLDNQGVEVSFCGLAVTAGRTVNQSGMEIQRALPRGQGRDDRLRQVWRSLFTQPDLVRFEPFCPLGHT